MKAMMVLMLLAHNYTGMPKAESVQWNQLCNGRPCAPTCTTTCQGNRCVTRCYQR